MKERLFRKKRFRIEACAVLFMWLAVSSGCRTEKGVPLSPGAAAFKQEVQQALGMLTNDLVEPVAKSDVETIKAVLKEKMPESLKLCRACPFMIGILDRKGEVLAIYPPKTNYSRQYSHYKLVVEALEKGTICQGRLFLADGAKLYTICSPLMRAGHAIGVIVLTTTDDEVKQRWAITEQEFLAIDFTR